MSGFDELETAQRVRDIIRKQTSKVIGQEVPKGLIGRVITMNPTRLKGMVWFPGDEQPIEVNFFPTTLPSSWSEKDRPAGAEEGTSVAGYGSTVRVERINGLLYVTDVLTGGSFGYNTQTMGTAIVKQQPNVGVDAGVFDVGSGITGSIDEATVAVRVGFAANLSQSDGLFFGPFVRQDKTEAKPGTFEIIVRSGKDGVNGVKLYECPITVDQEMKGMNGARENVWFRILPKHSSTVTLAGGSHDWDHDINVVDTGYSEVKGTFMPAFWLRITRARGGPSEIYDVTIRSTAFDQVGGYNLAESFVQQQHVDPPPPYGYLGFHNSNGLSNIKSDYTGIDTFNRSETDGWGLAFVRPNSTTGAQWSPTSGANNQYAVETSTASPGHDPADVHCHGVVKWTGTVNVQRGMRYSNTDTYLDMDMRCLGALQKMPAGAASSWGWEVRHKNSGADLLNIRLDHYASGEVYLKITKTVAGVTTTVGSDTLTITGWNQTKSIWFAFRIRGGTIQMKAWVYGTDEPATWGKTETVADASLLTAGALNYYATHFGGTTVTAPVEMYLEYMEVNVLPTTPPALTNKPWSTGPWRESMLRLANDIQQTWYINGDFRWNGSAISWTGNIWFQGVGPNRNGLVYGRAGLVMPDVGAQIPIVPYASATYSTVTSSGIPLAPYQSLWCAIEPGSIGGIYAMEGQLFIVDSSANTIGQDYYLPEWAVLIATASSLNGTTSPDLRLGNGQHLSGNRKMLAFMDRAIASANMTLTTTNQIITGLSMNVPILSRGAKYEAVATVDWRSTVAGAGTVGIGELLLDGVAQAEQIIYQLDTASQRATLTREWSGTLNPKASYATYTFAVAVRKGGTNIGTNTGGGSHSTLSVKVFE